MVIGRRFAHCGACGKKGVYATWVDFNWWRCWWIECRYCHARRQGDGALALEPEAAMLTLDDVPVWRRPKPKQQEQQEEVQATPCVRSA